MFDSKLFYDLCKKYGVELSDKYSEPMIKVNGEIIPLREYDFEEKMRKTTFYGFAKVFHNNIKKNGYINDDPDTKYDATLNFGLWSFFIPIMNVFIVIALFAMIFVKKDDLLKFGE